MAPPGFGPPGYSIPNRYMHREPPPDGADTNTRPYLIFFSYMTTCFVVAVFIILKLLKRSSVLQKSTTAKLPPRKHVYLFSALAAGSLLTTWTFMIKYFNVSYKTWLMWRSYYELDAHHRHWGLWLRETGLFREAWETVIVGNSRYWWSHQIFFFALGLGLYLEQKGMHINSSSRMLINIFRYPPGNQLHLGVYASRPDRGHKLCYQSLLPDAASEPTSATTSIFHTYQSPKVDRPVAS